MGVAYGQGMERRPGFGFAHSDFKGALRRPSDFKRGALNGGVCYTQVRKVLGKPPGTSAVLGLA